MNHQTVSSILILAGLGSVAVAQHPLDVARKVHNTDPCPHLPNTGEGISKKMVTVPGSSRQCCGCPRDHYLVSYCIGDFSPECSPCPYGTGINLTAHDERQCTSIDVTSHTLDNALKIGIPVAAVILIAIILLVVLVWRKKHRPTKNDAKCATASFQVQNLPISGESSLLTLDSSGAQLARPPDRRTENIEEGYSMNESAGPPEGRTEEIEERQDLLKEDKTKSGSQELRLTKTVETKNVEEDIPAKLKNNQVQLHQFHVEEGPQEKTSAEPFFAGNAIPSSDSDEHPTVVFRVESESMNSATASRASVSRSQQPETGETRQENVDECGKQLDAIHTSLCNLGSTNVLLEEMDVYIFGVNFGVKYIPLQECKREAKGNIIQYVSKVFNKIRKTTP